MSLSKSAPRSETSVKSALQSSAGEFDHLSRNVSQSEPNGTEKQPAERTVVDEERDREIVEELTVEPSFLPSRVFVNQIDSYHGKNLAEFLSERESPIEKQKDRGDVDADDEGDEEEDDDEEANFPADKVQMTRKLEIVGTVKDEEYKRPEDVTMVIRGTENKELLLRELMKCGVVIYDITQDDSQIEEANWALEAIVEELLKSRRDAPKAFERNTDTHFFILISTMMTWALTKPLDPENPDLPFTEEDYRKRKPHPNFKEHTKCEKNVATIAKRNDLVDKFKCLVVASGITYGGEEGPLHYLFKMAWHNADYLPIFGNGANKIPLLHVRYLSEVVYNLIKKWPKSRYIVAVEPELISQGTIVKKISKALANGKVELITPEEAFLFGELSQRSYDMANCDINIAPGYIVANELDWQSNMLFRDNIRILVDEYKKSRSLWPVKVIVLGPPASGKTVLARKLAQHYGIHYLHVKSVIEDTIQKLSKETAAADATNLGSKNISKVVFEDENEEDEEGEDVPGMDDLLEELNEIRTNLTENNGRLDDDVLNKLFEKRLVSKDCQNQGYVLDGYPKTLSQAKTLFGTDQNDEDVAEDESDVSTIGVNRKIIPELVIVLEASDEFLIERVIHLPEKVVQQTHYNEEGMLRRLKEYRERNTDEETPVQFFDECEIHPLFLNIEDDICPEMFSTFVRCIERLGEPRNYGLSDLEREEVKKRAEAEALAILKIEAARKEREDFERKEARKRKIMEWEGLMEKLKKEEEEQLCIMAEPLRYYLVKYILPTLTKGLIEVVKLRPDDPIDFLAEYLFRENPEGKMFEPDYTETMNMLLDAIDKLQEKILPVDELGNGDERYLKTEEQRCPVQSEKVYRTPSNDETAVMTEDDENHGQDGQEGEAIEHIDVKSGSETEAISHDSAMEIYARDSDPRIAPSFLYKQTAEGSRNSLENSIYLSPKNLPSVENIGKP